jgi:hypothetical protein
MTPNAPDVVPATVRKILHPEEIGFGLFEPARSFFKRTFSKRSANIIKDVRKSGTKTGIE